MPAAHEFAMTFGRLAANLAAFQYARRSTQRPVLDFRPVRNGQIPLMYACCGR
jgi:hypothetical protein